MSKIDFVARLKIMPGKMEEFIGLAEACMKIVRQHGEGTDKYDWFLEGDRCVVLETYENSLAALKHMEDLGEQLGQLLAISELTGELYGNPSEELRAALEPLDVEFYAPLEVKVS